MLHWWCSHQPLPICLSVSLKGWDRTENYHQNTFGVRTTWTESRSGAHLYWMTKAANLRQWAALYDCQLQYKHFGFLCERVSAVRGAKPLCVCVCVCVWVCVRLFVFMPWNRLKHLGLGFCLLSCFSSGKIIWYLPHPMSVFYLLDRPKIVHDSAHLSF